MYVIKSAIYTEIIFCNLLKPIYYIIKTSIVFAYLLNSRDFIPLGIFFFNSKYTNKIELDVRPPIILMSNLDEP